MTESAELASQVNTLQQTLSQSVETLNQQQAGQHPDAGGWSVLECLEHIFLVEYGVVRLLTKPDDQVTAGEKHVFGEVRMQQAMLNRTRKYPAPDAFSPKGKFATAKEAVNALEELRDKLTHALQNDQVSFDGKTIPHPVMGPLTRLDWVHFLLTHGQRHQQQIEEIKAAIGVESAR